jgi:hypothetical protein
MVELAGAKEDRRENVSGVNLKHSAQAFSFILQRPALKLRLRTQHAPQPGSHSNRQRSAIPQTWDWLTKPEPLPIELYRAAILGVPQEPIAGSYIVQQRPQLSLCEPRSGAKSSI